MCPPQAQAEVGSAMTEKTEMVCTSSPAPVPPSKPASSGPLPAEEVDHRNTCNPWLPPGVPVINLGHTRPTGAAMPTTELSAFRPSLLQLAALGTAPPTLALHYHPHPFLNSVYIGPAGPFSIFPNSRLKRRPSHGELDLVDGECMSVCVLVGCLQLMSDWPVLCHRERYFSRCTHIPPTQVIVHEPSSPQY